jgi:hypothetical protein
MQIKVEVDVRPEELRRFLGLPDVAGLQEDLIQFLREKVAKAAENFDPVSLIRDTLKPLGRGRALLKLLTLHSSEPPKQPDEEPAPAAIESAPEEPKAADTIEASPRKRRARRKASAPAAAKPASRVRRSRAPRKGAAVKKAPRKNRKGTGKPPPP